MFPRRTLVYNLIMEAKPKLLLVDDEIAITDRLAPFLSRAGFEVRVAADGEAALQETISYAPDLIVLDVLMPRLNGREVLRQLRQKGDWTPIILLTQVGESGERAMALMEGADDYINKPFDPNELVARIKTVLRRSSRQSQCAWRTIPVSISGFRGGPFIWIIHSNPHHQPSDCHRQQSCRRQIGFPVESEIRFVESFIGLLHRSWRYNVIKRIGLFYSKPGQCCLIQY